MQELNAGEPNDDTWYIDSGCSKHMTGNLNYLRDFKPTQTNQDVTFGNNITAKIKSYENITNGIPTERTPQSNRNDADQFEGEPPTNTPSLKQTPNPPLNTPSPNIQNNPDASFMGEPSNLFQDETPGEEQWDTEIPIIIPKTFK